MVHRPRRADGHRPPLPRLQNGVGPRRLLFGPTLLKTLMKIGIAGLIYIFLAHSAVLSKIMEDEISGLAVLQLPLGARLAGAVLAVLSVALVTFSYMLLIQRGSLMATTSLYPRRPIEENIGSLLDAAWPELTYSQGAKAPHQHGSTTAASPSAYSIQLLYVGRMAEDEGGDRVARSRFECAANPEGEGHIRSHWLTSGSPLAKNIVQIMVWEWVSVWLATLLILGTLCFNGFLTNNRNPDSFPRLTVMLIYLVAYMVHFCYVWIVCLRFFRDVFGGAAWSLLERARFVVAESLKLRSHSRGSLFRFRSIDKANENFVPTAFNAALGHPATSPSPTLGLSSNDLGKSDTATAEQDEGAAEFRDALAMIGSAQKTERATATAASALAVERVVANAIVMTGVTLSSGFASWTSSQFSQNSPNNTTTTQIGSLALLASLSLGAVAMFTSAMHLEILSSAFRNILSLKETKINGLAVDHYRKRPGGGSAYPLSDTQTGGPMKPLTFTMETVPLAEVGLGDFFGSSRSRGWKGLLGMALFGPGYAMLPQVGDHERKSAEVDFDFVARLRTGTVVLTTRATDRHAKNRDGSNVESINVCHIAEGGYGKEDC
ncbi:hypothetical protein AAE478_006529 [Parahypoxylon ruwenzoriense]